MLPFSTLYFTVKLEIDFHVQILFCKNNNLLKLSPFYQHIAHKNLNIVISRLRLYLYVICI